MKPTIPRHVALTLTIALLVSAVTSWPSIAGERSTRTSQHALAKITNRIAPGLTLTKIRQRKPLLRIFVLTASVSRRLTMDVALAGTSLPARATTSDIARRNGAIAAVNGDFSSVAGAPINTFQQDGQFVRVSSSPGILFSISKDERTVTARFVDRAGVGPRPVTGDVLIGGHVVTGLPIGSTQPGLKCPVSSSTIAGSAKPATA